MTLPALDERSCPPGTVLAPLRVTYTEAEVAAFLDQTGESVAAYRSAAGLRVPPALLLALPIRLIHANVHYETGVHTASELTVHRLPTAGVPLLVEGTVLDLYERRGDRYIVLQVTIHDDGPCVTIRHTSIYALRSRGEIGESSP